MSVPSLCGILQHPWKALKAPWLSITGLDDLHLNQTNFLGYYNLLPQTECESD